MQLQVGGLRRPVNWDNESGCIDGIALRKILIYLKSNFGDPYPYTKCCFYLPGTSTSFEITLGSGWRDTIGLSAAVTSCLFPQQYAYGGDAHTESHENILVNR